MPKLTMMANESTTSIGVTFVTYNLAFALYQDLYDRSTPTRLEAEAAGVSFTVKGKGLTYEDGQFEWRLDGGRINKIDVVYRDEKIAEITDWGNAQGLARALDRAEKAGTVTKVFDFMHAQKWTIEGEDGAYRLDDSSFRGESNFKAATVVRFGDGNDTAETGGGKDKVFAGGGQDNIDGGAGRDRLNGQGGNDAISGGTGRDRIDGGNGDDTLEGDEGNDLLIGGKGRDTLEGGEGNDRLKGGKGDDTFMFNALGGEDLGRDTIIGYNANQDTISLIGATRVSAEEVERGVLLTHSAGEILVRGGDIDDFATWDIA